MIVFAVARKGHPRMIGVSAFGFCMVGSPEQWNQRGRWTPWPVLAPLLHTVMRALS